MTRYPGTPAAAYWRLETLGRGVDLDGRLRGHLDDELDVILYGVHVVGVTVALREDGPSLGRPLVDRLQGSRIHHLNELGQALEDRQGSGSSSPSTRPAQHSC
jgi:hypothetical protein